MDSQTQKVAIVTGASKGLGAAIARRLAKEKIKVVASARSTDKLERLAQESGDAIDPVSCDVTDSKQVQDVIRHTIHRYGRLDYLINNAGLGTFAPVESLSEDDWDE